MKRYQNDLLLHSGIKGQKWGVRRFQNEDGTLTEEGKKRYGLKYGNISDEELRRAITRKRNEMAIVQMKTEHLGEKQKALGGIVRSIPNIARDVTAIGKNVYKSKSEDISIADEPPKPKAGASAEEVKAYNEKMQNRNIAELTKEEYAQRADILSDANKVASGISKLTNKDQNADVIAEYMMRPEFKKEQAKALENMSEVDDKQLQDIVNRMRLEKEYDTLINPPKEKAINKAREFFQSLGTLAALTLTVTQIVTTINKNRASKTLAQSDEENELEHSGVKGMKKGVRRYQNEDGSLTPLGYQHYGISPYDTRATAREKMDQINKAEQRELQKVTTERNRIALEKEAAINRLRIQKIQNREALRTQKAANKEAARVKKEEFQIATEQKEIQRKNFRKNLLKISIGALAAAGVVAAGYSYFKDKKSARMSKLKISELKARKDIAIEDELKKDLAEHRKAENALKSKYRLTDIRRREREKAAIRSKSKRVSKDILESLKKYRFV